MKKTIKLAVVAALALGATSAFATNGAALIGTGAKSRGMAGTSIGISHGAESALSNPALITSVKGTEISFGGTIFMPHVKNENNIGFGASSFDSDANLNVIPEVSLATKINDNFYVGIGMWGTGGMGVDYRDANSVLAGGTQMQMVTNLQLMQFGVPLAYTTNGFSVAVTPILQYGSLDINYEYPGSPNPLDPNAAGDTIGMGVAQDLKFGYNIGLAYTMSGFTVGAIYKSRIDMEYKGFDTVVSPFTATGYNNNKLSTPAEIGIGASYNMGEHTVAVDYKQIKWSDAKGYKDFEWDDQNVIALGYEYNTKGWAVRLGYNYASSPISEKTVVNPATDIPNSAGLQPGTVNTFNLLGFPGIVESHYAIGASYDISNKASVDVAYTYAPEVTNTYKNFAAQDITTKHSQDGVSVQLNYNF
ncbi:MULTISPECIES: OmpP1/FadL family transporter [Sulfurimonas]|uniref:OmpP1/FadL family transporter n=1 Tax=Sulfurimonas TaxID=202746 RepID=UPI00125FEA21|nr:outer membrane protein transport protein [Sulfurimonas hydrogeniphila]